MILYSVKRKNEYHMYNLVKHLRGPYIQQGLWSLMGSANYPVITCSQ